MSGCKLPAGPALWPVLLLTLLGCAKESTVKQPSAREIRFAEEVTKAGDSFSEGDRFYVWAKSEDGTILMERQEVVLTENGWTYAPVKFWPKGQSVTFWAVTPSPDAFRNPNPENEWLQYIQPNDASVETMTAGPVSVPEGQTVRLPFRHILTKVTLRSRTDRPAPATKSVRIRSIKISGLSASGRIHPDGIWEDSPGRPFSVNVDLNHIVEGTEPQPVGDYYFIPITAGRPVEFKIKWDVIYKEGGAVADGRISTFSRDDADLLRQNTAVSFSLALDGRIGLIDFEDENTKRLCVLQFDTDADGEISFDEAAGVTDLGTTFRQSEIARFNELRFFTSLTSIPASAFEGCSELEAITFPSCLVAIGEEAFRGCTSLASIDLSALDCTLGTGVFRESGLQSISLPNLPRGIPDDTFRDCHDLQEVTFVTIPQLTGKRAFMNCASLTSLEFHHGPIFDDEAFSGSGLESIDLSNVKRNQLGTGVFAHCRNLTWIAFGSLLTEIPDYTFQGCDGIYDLELPSRLEKIGKCAFKGCSGLRALDIPDPVTTIEEEAFAGCSNVVTITSEPKIAPQADMTAFGSSAEDYIGNRVSGTKTLRILNITSGYNAGVWPKLVSDMGYKKKTVWRF